MVFRECYVKDLNTTACSGVLGHSKALNDDRWMRHLKCEAPLSEITQALQLWEQNRHVEVQDGVLDTVSWQLTTFGSYSSVSAYAIQFGGSTCSCFKTIIWMNDAPLRCRIFCLDGGTGSMSNCRCLGQARLASQGRVCTLSLSSPEDASYAGNLPFNLAVVASGCLTPIPKRKGWTSQV
jgi:hypothetical protein